MPMSAPSTGPRPSPALVAFNHRRAPLRPRLPAAVAEVRRRHRAADAPGAGPVPRPTWIEYDPSPNTRLDSQSLTTASDAGAFTRLRAATTAAARHREREELVRDREAWIEDAGRRTVRRARDAAAGEMDTRFAKPQEIADAILFFASPRSDYITGQVLSVSGGLTFAG
jgi:hypothetical protein